MIAIPDLDIPEIDCTVCEDGGHIHVDFDDYSCWHCGTTWRHDGTRGHTSRGAHTAKADALEATK